MGHGVERRALGGGYTERLNEGMPGVVGTPVSGEGRRRLSVVDFARTFSVLRSGHGRGTVLGWPHAFPAALTALQRA